MSWRSRGARVLREPLVHFIVLGALIFAAFGNSITADERRIVIDAARVQRIAGQYAQNFRRAPNAEELDALIRDDVKEEVYYREALRLGLDRDDVVVRRRMRLKMEGFATTPVDLATPADATLQGWLDRHPARFAGEPRYSFDQRSALSLPAALDDAPLGDITAQFGEEFAAALAKLPLNQWAAVTSDFGQHEVRLRERRPAAPPRLAELRQRVENDWRAAQAKASEERAYQALRDGYSVTIERPR